MATKNFVVADDEIPYLLERTRLVEGDLGKFKESGKKEAVVFEAPKRMPRAAVRAAMRQKIGAGFAFTYVAPNGSKESGIGERHAISIRFGCTSFGGTAYTKLRKWALAK